jgi:ABC-type transport system involved in cytochrome c biogenesis permease component
MSFLPIAHRELISAARKRGTWIRRTLFFLTMLAIAAFVLADNSASPPSRQGESLFDVILVSLIVYASLIGVHATADAFGWEKREGTLGLLFLTDLSGGDVVAGKLAAKATHAFYGLLSMLPLLAMPMLLGGVRMDRVAMSAVMLVATSIVSLSIGLWVSSRSTNERRAMMATFGLLLVYLAGSVVAAAMSEEVFGGRAEDSWKYGVASPLMGLLHIQIITGGGGGAPPWPRELWFYSLGITLLVSMAAIVSAARHLPHSWSPELLEAKRRRKGGKILTPSTSPTPARSTVKSKIESWKRFFAVRQRPLLNLHPYIWLGERFADKRLMAGITTLAVLTVPFTFLPRYNIGMHFELLAPFFYIAAFFLLVWMVAEPIVRLNEDRRAGALELVLTTPLQGPEIIRGMQRSMERIFLGSGVILVVAAFATNRYALILDEDGWVAWAPIIYLAACFGALRWVGPWIGLSSKSVTTGRALLVLAIPAIVWIGAVFVMANLFPWRWGNPFPRELRWIVLGLALLSWAAAGFRCRSIYASPLRPGWRTAVAFAAFGALIIAAFGLSCVTLWMWGNIPGNWFAAVSFLPLHAVGMAILAHGWAKPQLQLRFRDLATRPFDN